MSNDFCKQTLAKVCPSENKETLQTRKNIENIRDWKKQIWDPLFSMNRLDEIWTIA